MTEQPVRFDQNATGPLSGTRVLDLSRLVAGNMLSMQLGDFGADVIKVEPHAGDPLRAWTDEGLALYWKVYGRNKRSITLDLRHKPAMDALWRLIETSNVFIENYRPGTLEKMGLPPEKLLAVNPNLIIVRVSGFGQTGPYAEMPGFGTIVEGLSGFAHRTGFPDSAPLLPPLALADMITGIYGASAVSMALLAIEKGKAAGQVIDLSLLEPIFSVLGPEMAIYNLTGKVKQRVGNASNTSAPRNVYRCADGNHLALSGSTQSAAERIFKVIGQEEMLADERFSTNTARVKHRGQVDEVLSDWFAQYDAHEALTIMRQAGATVGPIYSAEDISLDPHFRDREVFLDVEDADFGAISMHNIVPRLSETPGTFRYPAPDLGEHTDDILSEIGLDAAEMAQARARAK